MKKIIYFILTCSVMLVIKSSAFCQVVAGEVFELNKKDFDLGIDYPYILQDIILAQKEQEYLGKSWDSKVYAFPNTIGYSLSNYFHEQFHYDPNKKPLIVKINRLTVFGSNEHCAVDLSVTFYTENDGKYFELIQTGSMYSRGWSSLIGPSSRKYGKSVLEAFKECFLDLRERDEKNTLRNREVSKEELYQVAEFSEKNFPVLSKSSPQKGIFINFSDFIDAKPDTSIDFSISTKNTKHSNLVLDFTGPAPEKVWGGFNGEHYFIKLGNAFFPLEIDHQRLFVYLNSKDLASEADMNGLFFGALGYALTKAVESSSSKVVRQEIDWYSGRFINNDQVIFENKSKEKWGETCIYEDGRELVCLKKDQYFRYKYDPSLGIIRLTFQSGSESKEIFFNPLEEQMKGIKRNGQGLKIVDYLRVAKEDLERYLANKFEVHEYFSATFEKY